MTKRCFIEPVAQPDLAAFKRHLRITSSDMDAELVLLLKAAISAAEHHIGKVIARSRFVYSGDFARRIRLKGPELAVLSVQCDGEFIFDFYLEGTELVIRDGVPEGQELVINYVAGMDGTPEDIQAAILLHATALFNNPEDSVEVLPKASTNLLRAYRSWGHDGE